MCVCETARPAKVDDDDHDDDDGDDRVWSHPHYLRLTDYKLFHTTVVKRGQFHHTHTQHSTIFGLLDWVTNFFAKEIFLYSTLLTSCVGFRLHACQDIFHLLFWRKISPLGTSYRKRERERAKAKSGFCKTATEKRVENLGANRSSSSSFFLSPFFSHLPYTHTHTLTKPTPKLQGSRGRSTNLIENMTHELLHLFMPPTPGGKRKERKNNNLFFLSTHFSQTKFWLN